MRSFRRTTFFTIFLWLLWLLIHFVLVIFKIYLPKAFFIKARNRSTAVKLRMTWKFRFRSGNLKKNLTWPEPEFSKFSGQVSDNLKIFIQNFINLIRFQVTSDLITKFRFQVAFRSNLKFKIRFRSKQVQVFFS